MKTILVPTDFSTNADKALNVAIQLARKTKARIILVHACDLLELTFKDNLWLKKEYNNNIIREANQKLTAYCNSIAKTEKVSIRKKLYSGLVGDTIIHAAVVNKADLVVMGTLGDSGVKERILGSKTAAVIGNCPVPVLAIPLLAEWNHPKNILFALNSFTEGKMANIRRLLEIGNAYHANIHVMKFSDAAENEAYKYLAIERAGTSYARKMNQLAPESTFRFIHLEGKQFGKTVEKYIAKEKMDLLVMISHKRNFVKSLFHRSMTRKMAYHSNIPLLALPAQSGKAEAAPAVPATRRKPALK